VPSDATLILDQPWNQAAIFFALIGVAIVASFKRQYAGNPLVPVITPVVCGALLWLGVNSLTWSARIDDMGVAVRAPFGLLQRSASIVWKDMAAAEIIPCGWNGQGLHLVSRQNVSIVLPLDQIPRSDVSAVIARVTQHRTVRIEPDPKTFYAQAERIVPDTQWPLFRLRVRAARERMASAGL
jgi:hypothetical protein